MWLIDQLYIELGAYVEKSTTNLIAYIKLKTLAPKKSWALISTIISLFILILCLAWGSFFKRNGNYKTARIIKPVPRLEKSKFFNAKLSLIRIKKITYLLKICLCNKHNVWEMLSDVSPEFLSKPVSSSHFSTMKALGCRLIVEPSLPIYMNDFMNEKKEK